MPTLPPVSKPFLGSDPAPKPAFRGTTTQRGYGHNHQKLRRIVLAEEPICTMCQRCFSSQMHHIDGNSHNTDRLNLTGVCADCHHKHHAIERFAAR